LLDRLRSTVLDRTDLICRSGDGDGYLVVLSPRPGQRVDLEGLAYAVERAVEDGLAPMVSEVLREQPRITVGSARVLGNSLLRPERIAARLITDAIAATRNARERKAHRDRSTLQDIILGDGLTSVYQPIVDLGSGEVFRLRGADPRPARHPRWSRRRPCSRSPTRSISPSSSTARASGARCATR